VTAADRALIEGVLASSYTAASKLICIRAILDGERGPLPGGAALVTLARRVGLARRTAFRARDDLAGAALGGFARVQAGGQP
jgi:hypothetical protein